MEATTPAAAKSWTPAHTVTTIATGLIVLGSILPWASVNTIFGSIDKAGTDGDGVITLILGLVAFGLIFAGRKGTIGTIVASALVLLVAVIDIADVKRLADDVSGEGLATVSVGYGLWMVAVGAVGAIVGAVLLRQRTVAASAPAVA